MDFSVYITSRMLALVPTLWFAGWLICQTHKIKNYFIPYILTLLGIVAALIMEGTSLNSLMQGMLCAAAAVFGHQAFKQCTKAVADVKRK